jgi:hypothetical protein
MSVAGRTHTVRQDGAAPPPPPVQRVKVKGRVRDLGGSCPNISFTVDGRSVVADAGTRYDDGSCSSMRENRKVEVTGELRNDGRIRALEIEVDDDDDDD